MNIKLTKANIAEIVANIKKVMNYPSRLNDDLLYEEIGEAFNNTNNSEEVLEKLSKKGYIGDKNVIDQFYRAAADQRTLSTAKITDYVYNQLKDKPSSIEENDLYEIISAKFNEYRHSHKNISPYSTEFWSNLYDYVPGLTNYTQIGDETNIDTFLNEVLYYNKLDKLFDEINATCIQFQKIISESEDQFNTLCFEISVPLENSYSRFTAYGPRYI